MIICNNQLNDSQLNAVNRLAELCHEADKGVPKNYHHLLTQKRTTENNVLYFQEDNLLGFLSVYFFYDDACEISLMVDPTHRRQGIARQLLRTIMPLLKAKDIKTLIFSAPPTIDKIWLSRLGFSYQNSEYQMQRHSYEPILIANPELTVRKASLEDIPALCVIDEACFPKHQANMIQRFNNLFNDSNYTILIALINETAVGKAHIRWQTNGAIFSDIAILPHYQHQGWGGELLAYCINHALILGKTNLILDVETSNRNALKLYTRHGFKTTNINDYWAIPINKLCSYLK